MIASLHLHRVHGLGIAKSVAHMALDRRSLAEVEGLRFWKLLGTGRSDSFSVRDADPSLWGFFGVWESRDAHVRFLESARVAKSWAKRSDEQWSTELVPIRWKGEWSRCNPFAGFSVDQVEDFSPALQIAVLTRARVRPTQWRSFAKSIPPVAASLKTAEGLRFSVGIGEAPIGLQATFSMWSSADAIAAFAYRGEAHRLVVQRTATNGWYAEELFSRYAVLSERGAITGVTS
jgi:heme-degrading monooxygenase HmoA